MGKTETFIIGVSRRVSAVFALTAFCSSKARISAVCWAVAAVFFLIAVANRAWAEVRADARRVVLVMDIIGPITPAKKDFLVQSLAEAKQRRAGLLILRLDTPGGLLASTRSMVENLLAAEVPTVVFVSPAGGGAISAGVFITLASHFAYMAPGTSIGAAHPVTGVGGNLDGDMRDKLQNYAAAFLKSVAEKRNRNVAWAELAVRESAALTAQEAADQHVVDGIASNLPRLLLDLEGKTAVVNGERIELKNLLDAPQEVLSMGFRLRFIDFLSDPNIALLLGMGGLLAIAFELATPGGFLCGTMGFICVILSLIAAQTLPINLGGVALLVLSVVLLVVEFFVPSFGAWGAAGILCLVLGSIYFLDQERIWTAAGLAVSGILVGGFVACFILALLLIALFVTYRQRRMLRQQKDQLIDRTAQVLKVFSSVSGRAFAYGKIEFGGKEYPAEFRVIDKRLPAAGAKVRIVGVAESGRSLIVEAIEE